MSKRTQTGEVLAHLIRHGSITTYEAYQKYGCTRLPARIFDYREMGYDIESDSLTTKNRYGNTVTVAVYRLKGMPDAAV